MTVNLPCRGNGSMEAKVKHATESDDLSIKNSTGMCQMLLKYPMESFQLDIIRQIYRFKKGKN